LTEATPPCRIKGAGLATMATEEQGKAGMAWLVAAMA